MIDFTSMGVKKRVEKLLEQNVIKISALLNVEALNLQSALVLLEIEGAEDLRHILKRFRNCPRVVHIFSALGGYNLIALVMLRIMIRWIAYQKKNAP